jgi:hypothetical protein
MMFDPNRTKEKKILHLTTIRMMFDPNRTKEKKNLHLTTIRMLFDPNRTKSNHSWTKEKKKFVDSKKKEIWPPHLNIKKNSADLI